MDSLKGTLTPMKVLQGTLNGGIAYGTFNYNELENKPSVNGTELVGNITIDIPTKTSDLDNDSGFITSADVPTKTSELDNDSGFITSADVPTKTSELDNDSGFITSEDIPTIPTSTSELNNDSGFLTMNTTPVKSVNSQTGDVNLFIPNATSQLTNDTGFITENDIPVDSVNGQTGEVELTSDDISYDGGTKTVWDKVEEVDEFISQLSNKYVIGGTKYASGITRVDFGVTFSSPPVVSVIPVNSTSPQTYLRSSTLVTVTTTYFEFVEIAIQNNSATLINGTDNCMWLAVGNKA